MLTKLLAMGLGAMIALAVMSYIPIGAHAGEAQQYALTVTLAPVAGSVLEQEGATPIVITPEQEPIHAKFESKAACEEHFTDDIPGIVAAMSPLTLNEDYDITHVCEPAKTAI